MTNPPSANTPIADLESGMTSAPWYRFFTSLNSKPGKMAQITVGASPFKYTVPSKGVVVISGGTVSLVQLTRATTTIPIGAVSGVVPVGAGDILTVTYSAIPAMSFLPN